MAKDLQGAQPRPLTAVYRTEDFVRQSKQGPSSIGADGSGGDARIRTINADG